MNNNYVSKKDCQNKGFIKTGKVLYKMNVLERYLKKGWLRFGSNKYTDEERFRAAMKFYSDFRKGHILGVTSSSWGLEKIDGRNTNSKEDFFDIRNRYFSALKSIPPEFWEVVRKVCIEDMDLEIESCSSARRKLEMSFALKRDLCRGLDRLIKFYLSYKNEV